MSARHPRQVPPPIDGKAPSLARFVPREELISFSAWAPESLASEACLPPVTTAAKANPKPGTAPGQTATPPEASVNQQLHAARQNGYQDGYRDGLAALEAFKQSFATQLSSQIGALVRNFDADLANLEQDMASALARTAIELSRQVVRSEITQRPEQIAQVANEAIETLLLSARHIRVRVHPEDLPLVSLGAGDELAARQAQLLGDASLHRGDLIIDSDIGAVDARVATRWTRAAAALGVARDWDYEEHDTDIEEATSSTDEAKPDITGDEHA